MGNDSGKKWIFIAIIAIFVISLGISVSTLVTIPRDDSTGANIADEVKAKRDLNNELLGGQSSSAQNQLDNIFGSKTGNLEGVVRKLEASIYQQGTHYLEAGGITLVILESKAVNLDKYIGKNVKVFGSSKPTVEGDGALMDVTKIVLAE